MSNLKVKVTLTLKKDVVLGPGMIWAVLGPPSRPPLCTPFKFTSNYMVSVAYPLSERDHTELCIFSQNNIISHMPVLFQ